MTEGNRRGKAFQMERNDRNVDKEVRVFKLYVRMVKKTNLVNMEKSKLEFKRNLV